MADLCIHGGSVYDPANGCDSVVQDVWISDGKIITAPADPVAERTIDATGLIVMPGGVDMHSHIAGPVVNAARRLNPRHVPNTRTTGHLYAGLGYTTAVEAAVLPLAARHAHLEFADTPVIDKAMLLSLADHHYVLERAAVGDATAVRDFVAWVLGSTGGYGVKIVNPGGVETFRGTGRDIASLDEPTPRFGATPRQILTHLAAAADDLKLPHPVHVHCNHLGLPGNAATTRQTFQALDGRRAHVTHIQFHSYGGAFGDQSEFRSAVPELADYVNSHPSLTVDVGQVLFGEATALTGDTALGHYLHRVTGRRWTSADVEVEGGCGVVPITYKESSFVHALQWAAGLEWYLLVRDPWRVAMSTDHPNGGAFVAYPEVIALLMSRDYRREVLARLPAKVRERSSLAELDREYTLNEIAIITRAGPARILGMTHKGHLGIGADADVTIYTPNDDKRTMFELPRWVIRGGQIVAESGEVRASPVGLTWSVAPEFDTARAAELARWFADRYTIRLSNFALTADEVQRAGIVRKGPP